MNSAYFAYDFPMKSVKSIILDQQDNNIILKKLKKNTI